jgi:long-chain acyl-CoA synthetase
MLDLRTVNDIFLRAASRGPKRVILYEDPKSGWEPILSLDLRERVRRLAAALRRWGVQRGDRVILLAENRWEWPVADFAVLAIGAISVPLYPTETPDHIAYMIEDSGARLAIVSTAAQYRKLESIRTHLSRILVMDKAAPGAMHQANHFSSILNSSSLEYSNAHLESDARAATPDSLATIIYTSGTTGVSKGVMLTHGNIASNVNHSTTPFGFSAADTCISFLPLSHITARHLDYALFCYGSTVAYCTRFDYLVPAMKAVRPTIFVGVPRVYEKVRQAVEQKASASPIRGRILAWASKIGADNRRYILQGARPSGSKYSVAAKLVFGKIRSAFGGRTRLFISGGAPLGLDTANWFADMGIRIFEGYGLTETSPVVALNNAGAYRIGSVGKMLPNVDCRIAPDGEIEVRGPAVFPGYWNQHDQTAASFTTDGWFRTGDIGRIDPDGFLFITDRKKELLKTSGGKFIAPQPIENKLKSSRFVAQAALVGDKHKFASVLISPNFDALTSWAAANGIAANSRAALVTAPDVLSLFQQIVDRVNDSLASFETIKHLHLVPDEWSIETGELTPSLKLKRRVITERYATQIAAFYVD